VFANSSRVYYCVVFTAWVLDQQDRDDSVGKLARLIIMDHNAGCAVMYRDPISWKKHFELFHRPKLDALMDMLGDAYVEYCTSLGTRTDSF
jgi:hypothetical protein